MRKLLKIIVAVIVVIILIFVIGGILLVKFVNPNDFKNQISRYVYNETGQQLIIKGDIGWSFFPWLGLKVNDVTLNNPQEFSNTSPLAHIGQADVSIQLLPLIAGKIDLGKLALKDLSINLIKNKTGQTNWQNLLQAKRNNASAPNMPATTDDQTTSKKVNFTISSLDITNANATLVNQQTGKNITIQNLDLQTANVNFTRAFPVSLKMTLISEQPKLNTQINFNSKVTINTTAQKYELKDLNLTVNLLDNDLPNGKLSIDTSADIALDLKAQTLNIANLTIMSDYLQAQGQLQANNFIDNPSYAGSVQISQLNLRGLMYAFKQPLNTQDSRVLQKIALKTKLQGTNHSLQLQGLEATIDDTSMNGDIAVTNFATRSANFNLTLNKMNLDSYMPAATKNMGNATNNKATNVVNNNAENTAANNSPFAALDKAVINGSFRADALTVAKIDFTKVYAQVAANNGIIKIAPMNADVYGGSTKGNITIDIRNNMPNYEINENLTNIQVSQLIKSNKVSGNADVTANLTMSGNNANAIMRTLNGNTRFTVRNGVIQGIGIVTQLQRAYAFVKQEPLPAPQNANQTDFAQLTGTGTFTNGVFNNKDLLLQSSALRVTGNGAINLVSQGINYHISAVAMHTITNTQGKTITEARQTEIPLLITGTINNPAIVPDFAALSKTLLKGKIGEQINKALGGNAVKDLNNAIKKININDLLN